MLAQVRELIQFKYKNGVKNEKQLHFQYIFLVALLFVALYQPVIWLLQKGKHISEKQGYILI